MVDIICISHLRWDFVWQRPQHLLSRLSKHYRVLYVEEPASSEEPIEPQLEVMPTNELNLTVVRLRQRAGNYHWIGHGDPHTQPVYTQLLLDYLEAEGYTDSVLWLYTPMASDFIPAINPRLVVYDVMDQLSAFKNAPPQIVEKEHELLKKADLVFTGGVSLYRARQSTHPHIHLFPSGVDKAHYAKASRRDRFEKPEELAGISGPVVGYFGVIDERMDLPLLTQMAESHPDWTMVMVGPIAKISRRNLPATPNVLFCGMKTYDQLPAYLSYFDVALIPFALNEATRYVSPTKTLEYMAAHKPIVSTPIHDVIELYGEVVRVGHTSDEFIAQVEAAIAEMPHEKQARLKKEQALLTRYGWENITHEMNSLIMARLEALSHTARREKQQRLAGISPSTVTP